MSPSAAKVDFWSARARWPHNRANFVFLGDALMRVGQTMFGSEWTGDEPLAYRLVAPTPPGSMALRSEEAAYSYDLNVFLAPYLATPADPQLSDIASRRAEWSSYGEAQRRYRVFSDQPLPPPRSIASVDLTPRAPRQPPAEPLPPACPPVTDEEMHAVAQSICLDHNVRHGGAADRMEKAAFAIVHAAEGGTLITAAHPNTDWADKWADQSGWRGVGAFRLIPPPRWSTDLWRNRFSTCQINVRTRDADGQEGGDQTEWATIFVDADTFATLLASIVPPPRALPRWAPAGSPKKTWAVSAPAQQEASSRMAMAGLDESPTNLAKTLDAMWGEVTGEGSNVDSMAAILRRDRQNVAKGRNRGE